MAHTWRWHGSTRVLRWTRLTTTIGLLLASALAALPAAASASAPEVRGEWTLVLKYPGGTVNGTALVTEEANVQGEFAAHSVILNGSVPGGFKGTLEGSTATVETSSQQYGPFPPGKFNSNPPLTVDTSGGSLSLSGGGTFAIGGEEYPATLVATRVKTYKQIEEQEAREKQEQEERAARDNVRGEWAITLEGGARTVKGTALISEAATSKNEFASESALFEEGLVGGSFGGTLQGDEAEVTITTSEVPGVVPSGTFTGEHMTVSSKTNPTSITGTGTFTFGPPSGASFPTTLTATRVRSYQQIEEEREAKAKAEREAEEKAEREAKAKAEQEAKAKAEQEAIAKAAREAKEKQEKTPILGGPEIVKILPLVSVKPTAKTVTVSGTSLLLALENPNSYGVRGHLTLSFTEVGKSAATKHQATKNIVSLGSATFSLTGPSGSVKVKLTANARAELARHKTLHAILTITTRLSGQPTVTKRFSLTLRAVKPAHGKH